SVAGSYSLCVIQRAVAALHSQAAEPEPRDAVVCDAEADSVHGSPNCRSREAATERSTDVAHQRLSTRLTRCSACERVSKDLGVDATLPLILRRLPTMDITASRTPRAGHPRIAPNGPELARSIEHQKAQFRVARRLEMLLFPVGKVQQFARVQRERLPARRGGAPSTHDVDERDGALL